MILTPMYPKDPARALGLEEGDVHVIRNAGGRATDALRSVIISQQLLGTREIVIVHHVLNPYQTLRLSLDPGLHLVDFWTNC